MKSLGWLIFILNFQLIGATALANIHSVKCCCSAFILSDPAKKDTIKSEEFFAFERKWNTEFIYNEQMPEDSTFYLVFEIWFNNEYKGEIKGTEKTINKVLKGFEKDAELTDHLRLVALPPLNVKASLKWDDEEITTKGEEVSLDFYGDQAYLYAISFYPAKDFYFIYVDKSGGIKNLRQMRTHIDRIVENGHQILIYFNALGNPMIITDPDNLMDFYNTVFTAITQPPFPSREYRSLVGTLGRHLPEDIGDRGLHLKFYMSQVSYELLNEVFFPQLLNEHFPGYRMNPQSITVYTDFEVQNKKERIKYKKITDNH